MSMGTIRKPQEVKLFTGIIAVSEVFAQKALEDLEEKYGRADFRSPLINFDFTDYYAEEMGKNLKRMWAGFEMLIDPGRLPEIKTAANGIEEKYSISGKRQVNIDPGYVTPAKIVLASSKDFSHRVYMAGGIYGEVTLMFKNKSFIPLDWTYPDYKSKTAMEYFLEIRRALQERLKSES